MDAIYRYLFSAMWASWAAYWFVMSGRVKVTIRRESLSSRFLHVLPLVLAAVLLWAPVLPVPFLGERLFPMSAWIFGVGALITGMGLLFTVSARRRLGQNWSGTVTIKDNHELITTGPYAIVRHPIYSGLLLAFVGSAIARGEWRGVVAVALVWWSFWRKSRIEELWMFQQFGDAYERYRRHVAALIPFVI